MTLLEALKTFASEDVVSTNGYDCNLFDYMCEVEGTDDAGFEVYVDGKCGGIWEVGGYNAEGFRSGVLFLVIRYDSYGCIMSEED